MLCYPIHKFRFYAFFSFLKVENRRIDKSGIYWFYLLSHLVSVRYFQATILNHADSINTYSSNPTTFYTLYFINFVLIYSDWMLKGWEFLVKRIEAQVTFKQIQLKQLYLNVLSLRIIHCQCFAQTQLYEAHKLGLRLLHVLLWLRVMCVLSYIQIFINLEF